MSSEISVNVFKSLVEKNQEYSLLKKENSNNKKNAMVESFIKLSISVHRIRVFCSNPSPGLKNLDLNEYFFSKGRIINLISTGRTINIIEQIKLLFVIG